MTRHFFLIALLSVLLPGGFMPQDRTADAPRPFVVALRAMPASARAASRSVRKSIVARPVRGVYLIPARQPKSLSSLRPDTSLTERILWRPSSLRAPPSLA